WPPLRYRLPCAKGYDDDPSIYVEWSVGDDAAMDDDHLIAPRSLATRLADADEAYSLAGHVPLADGAGRRRDEVRAAMAAGRMPRPAYVLDDGTEMVAADHLAFSDEAGADL